MAFPLSPLNDFSLEWKLKTLDMTPGSSTLGKLIPLTTGTVSAFLATSNSPTATAADPTLTVVCTHVGSGKWISSWNADVLTPTLLETLFAAATPYAICVAAGDVRKYAECEYVPAAAAEVT